MQHCEECNAELPSNALFCVHCGRKTTSENEITSSVSSASIEDILESSPDIEMSLNDSPGTTSGNEEEHQQQTSDLNLENDTDAEERSSYLISNNEKEEQTLDPVEEQPEQYWPDPASEHEVEEQTLREHIETTGSMPGDADSDQEILAAHLLDEQPQLTQVPIVVRTSQSPYTFTQKAKSRTVSRGLLYSLVSLIFVVGVIVALMRLFDLTIPGFGGNSNAQSTSSYSEIIDPNGSSLTASICLNTSTPSTSETNQGSAFVLTSSSGCSTITASKASSLCIIFPSPQGASHKYIVDVSNASISSNAYHLVLGVEDYTGPATYNDAKHISIGLSEGTTGRNFSWLYRHGNVVINNDQQSGTLDVILAAVNGGNTLHIMGDWACGRMMKNA